MATVYTEQDVARVETTGSLVEAAGGIAVVVLSIIALSRAAPGLLSSISVIILGAALLAEGATIATEFSRLYTMASGGLSSSEVGGGMMTEIFIGAAVLVLGILAIIGVSTAVLIPAAIVAAGAMMLITAGGVQRMSEIRVLTSSASGPAQSLAIAAGRGAAGFQILSAIAAIVLGIIALTAAAPAAGYSMVALLILGASIALSGTAITGSAMRFLSR